MLVYNNDRPVITLFCCVHQHGRHTLCQLNLWRLSTNQEHNITLVIQYNIMQYNTIQYNTIQYNVIKYKTCNTSASRGPSIFPSFYGQSAKCVGHETRKAKNEDLKLAVRTKQTRLIRCLLYSFVDLFIPGKDRNHSTF